MVAEVTTMLKDRLTKPCASANKMKWHLHVFITIQNLVCVQQLNKATFLSFQAQLALSEFFLSPAQGDKIFEETEK